MISHRSPDLPVLAILAVLPFLSPARGEGPTQPPQKPQQKSEADAVLARSVATLQRLPHLTAAVRYIVHGPRGERLVGRGRYEELQQGERRLTRFELAFDVAGKDGFRLLQVHDGQWLWTERILGEKSRITRVAPGKSGEGDSDWADSGGAESAAAPQAGLDVGVGGLSGWTVSLRQNFTFHSVQAGILHHGEQRLPVLRLEGRLSETTRERLGLEMPPRAGDAPLPGILPWCVQAIVATDDLLPRRIEFYRTSHDDRPMAMLDFHAIETGPTARPAPERFHFEPGDDAGNGSVDGQ